MGEALVGEVEDGAQVAAAAVGGVEEAAAQAFDELGDGPAGAGAQAGGGEYDGEGELAAQGEQFGGGFGFGVDALAAGDAA
ncbi:hypothetical protein ACFQ9X_25915 [Catenulispora yoronensis]